MCDSDSHLADLLRTCVWLFSYVMKSTEVISDAQTKYVDHEFILHEVKTGIKYGMLDNIW